LSVAVARRHEGEKVQDFFGNGFSARLMEGQISERSLEHAQDIAANHPSIEQKTLIKKIHMKSGCLRSRATIVGRRYKAMKQASTVSSFVVRFIFTPFVDGYHFKAAVFV
jgi:hypothetical protein